MKKKFLLVKVKSLINDEIAQKIKADIVKQIQEGIVLCDLTLDIKAVTIDIEE